MAVKSRTAQTRRGFLQLVASGVGSAVLAKTAMAEFRYLAPVNVDNPLAAYPNRDWERIYRVSTGRTRVSHSFAALMIRITVFSTPTSKTT